MRPPIEFWVDGQPKGQPRARAFARKFGQTWQARLYDSGTAEGWKNQIAIAWKAYMPSDFVRFDGPVAISIAFKLPRPKSHFLKAGLRPNAPTQCCDRTDVDNYCKAAMDALTQLGVWADDKNVCDLDATKQYVQENRTPGASIRIIELEP